MVARARGEPALLPRPRRVAFAPRLAVPVDTPSRAIDDPGLPPQGYRISIDPSSGVTLAARDAPGLFYARATLTQLRQACGGDALPAGTVEDWPDLRVRGVMLDVSRTKVPTLETLYEIVDRLASWKVNHLELYFEHTFAYRDHAQVWSGADPYDAADIGRLAAYCAARHIELVPNQNTLGHMERWLLHERYAPLGIARGVVPGPLGLPVPASTLDPANPGSLALARELLGELGDALPAQRFHVGLDEPVQLPPDRHEEWAGWATSLRALPELDGRELLLWGDFLAAHPSLLGALGDGMTVCEWGYEANHPFRARGEALARARVSHWLCPGTSSWLSILGRVSNAIEGCRAAADAARHSGASGLMVTDWGDFGHHQYLPVADPGLAAAAALAWCAESNRDLDPATAGALLSMHAYADESGALGGALAVLGDVHTLVPCQVPNMASLVAHVYLPQLRVGSGLSAGLESEHLDAVEAQLAHAAQLLTRARPGSPHGRLAVPELANGLRLVRLACHDARARLAADGSLGTVSGVTRARLTAELDEVIDEHRRLWLHRNRPGGLDESCAWLEHLRDAYRSGAANGDWAGPLVAALRPR